MHLGQIKHDGATVAAIFEGGGARPIPAYTLSDLISRADAELVPLNELAARLATRHAAAATPLIPICPAEVWASGCTYETSATFRDGETITADKGTREGMYAHVYRDPRPEIFFKGTARVCVGPGQNIGIRADSKFTAPEPELAVVLGKRGRIVGYTLANDVSAWDIERENALYLPQSKVYTACCSLGPVMVTPDEIKDPYNLHMTCEIVREGIVVFSGETSTAKLHRKIESIVEYLIRSNPVPAGSVLCTGTGIIVTEEVALQPGDVVRIRVPEIGELANTCAVV
jgi:2-dehydro-3-deoxy-D-arabinonate dehydratase